MKEDSGKKNGCCLGGCCWFIFIVFISFLSGWFFANYEHSNWDMEKAKEDSIRRGQNHINNIKNYLLGTFSWANNKTADNEQKQQQMVPEIPNTQNWEQKADEAAGKGYDLLRQARNVEGDERQRLIRVAKQELKNALDDYVRAEQVDTGNQKLTEKIAGVSQMLERLGGR